MDITAPPESLRAGMGPYENADHFVQSGRATLDLARQMIALSPSDSMLDVGCGCGRVALACATYLAGDGRYAGFDVDAECVEWCTKHIAAQDSRFQFTTLDVRSDAYNPNGRLRGDSVRLPYTDGVFDAALISSVFTHMLQAAIEHYICELSRVLRPGGRSLFSVFLVNPASREAIRQERTLFVFNTPVGEHSWTMDPSAPLEAMAVEESWLVKVLGERGLTVTEVRYGDWREHRGLQVQQDWLAVRRD